METGVDPKSNMRNSRIEEDDIEKIQKIADIKKKIEPPKLHKKLDFNLPVKFKSQDHFKLQAIMTKLMSNAKKDMDTHCEEKAMENLLLVKYYMTKIEN